jgi:hypothetical protein
VSKRFRERGKNGILKPQSRSSVGNFNKLDFRLRFHVGDDFIPAIWASTMGTDDAEIKFQGLTDFRGVQFFLLVCVFLLLPVDVACLFHFNYSLHPESRASTTKDVLLQF